jgi:hypothetical protein
VLLGISRRVTMTSFVHTQYPIEHPGVARATHVAQAVGQAARNFDGAKGLATLLLAAVVSAMLVAANQIIDTWSDGHLLLGWVALWAIAFSALALLATPARNASKTLRSGYAAWKVQRKAAIADEKLWDLAQRDARVMAEISRAMGQAAGRDVRAYY